jgi:hypothetical protein
VPKKPVYMDPEEVKKRVADGLKNWRRQGRVLDLTQKMAGEKVAREARLALIRHSQAAIMHLAEREFSEWAHEVFRLRGIFKQHGLGVDAFANTLQGIEVAAIAIAEDPLLGNHARHFLQENRKRRRIYSIAGTKPGTTTH